MTLLALDLNATRIRAALGATTEEARPVALEGQEAELLLAVSLEGRHPEVGRAGTGLCRRSPHLACLNFLPHLGHRREWAGPRQRLDATRALTLAFEQVVDACSRHQTAAAAVPGYLSPEQTTLLRKLATQTGLRLHGTVDVALAAALAAHAQQPWTGLALVADADENALTWSVVAAEGGAARVLQTQPQTALGLSAWKERLLSTIADTFIRKSRRDPRDSAEAEQMLYDQLEGVLAVCHDGQQVEVAVQAPQWYQNLVLGPQDLGLACAALRERALAAFSGLCSAALRQGTPRAVVLTAAAARLPGLAASLEQLLSELALPEQAGVGEDFGDGLLADEAAPPSVRVLSDEAVCQAVHELAAGLQRQSLSPGHLAVVPLPQTTAADAGPARLLFRGQEHLLGQSAFSLGRDPRCDLSFDSAEFPSVSGRHCEIVCDQQGFTLVDRSRHGTLVNNRPVVQQRALQAGDWIRLGPGGPLLRFLGQAADRRKLMTTA
jgi:hypothetical protein